MTNIPPGLRPAADDLDAYRVAMTDQMRAGTAERIAKVHAPLMLAAHIALIDLHECSPFPKKVCTACHDAAGNPEPWPCPTLCALSQAMEQIETPKDSTDD